MISVSRFLRKIQMPAMMAVAMLAMSSCLDESPKSLLDEDKAYDTPANLYINAVATLYNYIGGRSDSQGIIGTCRGVYDYNTFTTDEAMLPTRGGDWYDGGLWQNMYLHTWTPSDQTLNDTWNYLYKVIILCNHSLSVIDKHKSMLTDARTAAYKAEVTALRSLFYYELLDMFGNVPVVTSETTKLSDARQIGRSRLYARIIADLQQSLPYLPDERSNYEGDYYGRMTRPVAHFLLARLFLNSEVYADDDWTDGQRPDGSTMLFDIDGFTILGMKDGGVINETKLPDPDNIYDQQYRKTDEESYLEVFWYDGTVRQYSAADGEMIKETQEDAKSKDLEESFDVDGYHIVSRLHEAPEVQDSNGNHVTDLESDGALTYVTPFQDMIVTEYLSEDGKRYGYLLNGSFEKLAYLPDLCDITDDGFVFDEDGSLRFQKYLDLEDLKALGNAEMAR